MNKEDRFTLSGNPSYLEWLNLALDFGEGRPHERETDFDYVIRIINVSEAMAATYQDGVEDLVTR